MKTTRTALGLALAIGAGVVGTTPAVAATTTTGSAAVWAAFATQTDQYQASDNLHFYVETPVITADQVGYTATFVPQGSKLAFDCGAAIAVVSPTSWTQVGSIWQNNIQCHGTSYIAHITITPDMVGKRLELNGWAAAPDSVRTATVSATVRIGGQVFSGVDSTRRDAFDAKAPVQQFGTWYGQQVGIATANGSNEFVVGKYRQAMPDGDVLHASFADNVADVWLAEGQERLVHWTRSLATGRVDVQTWHTDTIKVGTPGVYAKVYDQVGAPDAHVVMDWSGVVRARYSWAPTSRTVSFDGFTATTAVFEGDGQGHTKLHLHPMAGGPAVTWDAGTLIRVDEVRADGVVVTKVGMAGQPVVLVKPDGTETPMA